MNRTNIAVNLDGGISYSKFTLTYRDFTDAATTQTVQLLTDPEGFPFAAAGITAATVNGSNFQMPQGAFILYVRFKATVRWASATVTNLTLTLQKTGGTDFVTPATVVSGDQFVALADTTLTEFTGFAMDQHSAFGLCVLATATAANLSALTAGATDIYIAWISPSTPSA